MNLGSTFLRQDSEMTQRVCLRSALLTKEVLGAGLSQDCALSVTDPSQKAISEPFVRQVQVPIFAVNKAFLEIFGEGQLRGDDVLANRVVVEFARTYPNGKQNTKKRAAADFALTSYTHSYGSKQAAASQEEPQSKDEEWTMKPLLFP